MVFAGWIIAILVVAFLLYTYLQVKQLRGSLESLRNRLGDISAKTDEGLAALQEQLKGLKSAPAESANGGGSSSEDEALKERFQTFLDDEINPAVASHGGSVTLIDVKDNIAFVQMGGGCQGCGMVNVTLKQGIEARMNEVIPEIKEIVDTTDHRGGTNPYFQPGKGSPMF
jgi:Fe/S biogenesis protein NfuA